VAAREVEQGKKKRVVAWAFDWPGWTAAPGSVRTCSRSSPPIDPLGQVAGLAGFGAEFGATGEFEVVERLEGIGMTVLGHLRCRRRSRLARATEGSAGRRAATGIRSSGT
jgi:hypothetical protein